jgi:hypothetical protein
MSLRFRDADGQRHPTLRPPMTPLKNLLPPFCIALALSAAAVAAQADPLPTLSAEQQRAVGIVIAAAPTAHVAQRIGAYGRVLDPSRLVADAGRLESSRAAARAAAAETARLRGLYRGANASLKSLQVAEARQAEARATVRQAESAFLLRWGPLGHLGHAQRAALIQQLATGRELLLRADLPGRHSLGVLPAEALVDVDGVRVRARVLGALPQVARLQSVGLLLRMRNPPAGLGPGAQLPVMLRGADLAGRLVPDGALLYGRNGAYVYRAVAGDARDGDTRFAPLRVSLLQQVGKAWLVSGLRAGDRIVVQGAGVLWSMQGLDNKSQDDD